ncbi:type IV pilin protein [Cobetia marina]|uniref:Type IV pilin protein n=1 Tax=Cobetia marina TaxID=28258 RepID=A0ABU9GI20_COBMA
MIRRTGGSRSQGGFGLMELMIAVAIIGILAAIAYPSYQDQVERSRRTDAITSLLALAQTQERIMATCGEYATASVTTATDCDDALGLGGDGIGLGQADTASEESFYTLAVAGDADSYTLTATATGSQANDEDCATFTLTELGIKGAAVLADSEGTDSSNCW